MLHSDILIIGAGIAGLAAGRKFTKSFKNVVILEALEAPGGRILDVKDPDFPSPVMLGAEFIHGKLPLTLALLREAGIGYHAIEGRSLRMVGGQRDQTEDRDINWPNVMDSLRELKEDMSLHEFLSRYFAGNHYEGLREAVEDFAKGFDAADPSSASARSLFREWEMEEEEQYRVEGGYGRLVSFLEGECLLYGCDIHYNSIVKEVNWRRGYAEVKTADGRQFGAEKLIITVPAGVLQLKDESQGAISFCPPLPPGFNAIYDMGVGAVIKVVLRFAEPFWELKTGTDVGFIFTKAAFPTWWTQYPGREPVLTGWMAGPPVEEYRDASDERILQAALDSLSSALGVAAYDIQTSLLAWKAANWAGKPFSNGAYTYPTVIVPRPSDVLSTPVEGTLFFAGEAAYAGQYGGTVEAALASAGHLLDESLQYEISGRN